MTKEIQLKIDKLEAKLNRLEDKIDTLCWINSPKEVYMDTSLPKPIMRNPKSQKETHVN